MQDSMVADYEHQGDKCRQQNKKGRKANFKVATMQ